MYFTLNNGVFYRATVFYYYNNEKIKVEHQYLNGLRNGIGIAYNTKGEVVEKALYKDDLIVKNLMQKK